VAAADENNMDAGLAAWNMYSQDAHAQVGRVNVHGYSNGTEAYRGPNQVELRRAVAEAKLFLSEYGDGDPSGYTLAEEIIRDIKELRPSAWIYWQPVEPDIPEFGWGLINANYIDTHDRPTRQPSPLVRVNRKFFVFGQFTRYLRPGYHLIEVSDPSSIAAYEPVSHRLVIVKVTGDAEGQIQFDLSKFSYAREAIHLVATTTTPGGSVPDWKQHKEMLRLTNASEQRFTQTNLYSKSVYTFVIEGVLRRMEYGYTYFRKRSRK
jgi:galactan endo-1,6-beta-galactosidase